MRGRRARDACWTWALRPRPYFDRLSPPSLTTDHQLLTQGMAHVASPSVVRQLGCLFAGGSAAGLSDRQLIERFVSCRDDDGEAAFAALVARHGPMVLRVCRQLLGDR